jgi:ectoine hydroxylase-related dioxygenase (phytanoyl-CoA dioxygenase family)
MDASTIEQYARDGAVVLRGAVDRPWLELLAEGVEYNRLHPSPWAHWYTSTDEAVGFWSDYVTWPDVEPYRRVAFESGLAEMAGDLMQSSTVRFFHEHVLVKEPGNSMPTPWHQDQPYYLVEGQKSVSFWVPLDPVPSEIALEYVAGSHRWGKDFRPERFDGTSLYANDESERVPDMAARKSEFEIRSWAMQPGDAIAFDFRTLHGAPANTTSNRRRAISFRWVGDGATFVKRSGKTSPPFPDLEFENGAPFDGPEFPVVWPR